MLTGLLPSLAMPWVGWAVDRWGPRLLILLGLVAMGIGGILYLANQVWVIWFLSIALVAVGGSASVPLPAIAAVNNWFRRRRAMAMAALMLPSSVLSAAIHPLWSLSGISGVGAMAFLFLATPIPAPAQACRLEQSESAQPKVGSWPWRSLEFPEGQEARLFRRGVVSVRTGF